MVYDVAIVGGGPAGLSAALTLSRSLVKTLLIDAADSARNGAAQQSRALAGNDRIQPAELRRRIRDEIQVYGFAEFQEDTIQSASKTNGDGFILTGLSGASYQCDRILMATGMIDLLPEIANLDRFWGRSIINCPFCDGIEWHDRAWGIVVDRQEMLGAAEVYANWTSNLTLFIAPEVDLPATRRHEIEQRRIKIEEGRVVAVDGEADRFSMLTLADSRTFARDVLLIWPRQRQCPLIESLAPSLTDDGYVDVDAGFHSSLPGIYAAGDLVYGGHQNTSTAIHMGNLAAASIVFDMSNAGGSRRQRLAPIAP